MSRGTQLGMPPSGRVGSQLPDIPSSSQLAHRRHGRRGEHPPVVALLSSEARMPWPLREMYLAVAISSSVKGFSFCRQGRQAEQQRRWKGRQAGRQTGRQPLSLAVALLSAAASGG